jgi:hypothetical protein
VAGTAINHRLWSADCFMLFVTGKLSPYRLPGKPAKAKLNNPVAADAGIRALVAVTCRGDLSSEALAKLEAA